MSIKGPESSSRTRTQPCPSAAIVASRYPLLLCQRCRWYRWPHRFSLRQRKHVTFALGFIRNASTDLYQYAERGLGVNFCGDAGSVVRLWDGCCGNNRCLDKRNL